MEANNGSIIICAGMRRSGSTWLFNVVRYCYLNAGYRTYSDTAKKYRSSVPADVSVLKVHSFHRKYCREAERIFTTVRDLRDIVASMIRFGLTRNNPKDVARCTTQLINRDYARWAPYSNLEIRYEDMIRDRPDAIASITRVLGLPDVDPIEVHRDVEKLTKIVLPYLDRTTQIHPNHLTDGRVGGYEDTLSPQLLKIVEDVGASWLIEHGYEL